MLLNIDSVDQLVDIFTKGLKRELLNIFKSRSWDGKVDVILILRGSVTGCVVNGTRESQMMTPA